MSKRYVKIGLQTDLKTPAESRRSVRGVEVNFSADHNVVYFDSLDGYVSRDAYFGAHSFKGSMSVYAVKGHINNILEAVFGHEEAVDTNSDDVTDYYKYTLDTPKALTIEVGTEHNIAYELIGALVNSLRATFEPKNIVKFDCDLIIRSVKVGTYDFTYPSNDKPFIVGATTVVIDGSEYDVKSIELTIERNISDDEYVVGDMYLADIVYGECVVSGRITLKESDYYEFHRALFGGASATSPVDEPVTTDITIDAKTPDGADKLFIRLPSVIYNTAEARLRNKEPTEKTLEFRAICDDVYITVDA